MAAIPQFHQEQLASSLVGVPQMNNAGLTTADSLLRNSGELVSAQQNAQRQNVGQLAGNMEADTYQAGEYASQYQSQLVQKQNAQKALALKAEEMQDHSDIESLTHIATMNDTQIITDIQNNPDYTANKRPQAIKEALETAHEGILYRATNDKVRAGLTANTDALTEAAVKQANEQMVLFRNEQTKSLAISALNQSVSDVTDLKTYASFDSMMKSPAKQQSLYNTLPDAAKVIQEAYKNASIGVVSNAINSATPIKSVEALQKLQADGKFGVLDGHPVISGDEWRTLADHAQTTFELKDKQAAMSATNQMRDIADTAVAAAARGNPSLVLAAEQSIGKLVATAAKNPDMPGNLTIANNGRTILEDMMKNDREAQSLARSTQLFAQSEAHFAVFEQRINAMNTLMVPKNTDIYSKAETTFKSAEDVDKMLQGKNPTPMAALDRLKAAYDAHSDLVSAKLDKLTDGDTIKFAKQKQMLDQKATQVEQMINEGKIPVTDKPWWGTEDPENVRARTLSQPVPPALFEAANAHTKGEQILAGGKFHVNLDRIMQANYPSLNNPDAVTNMVNQALAKSLTEYHQDKKKKVE